VPLAIHPSNTALLIIDMQNCFVEGYPISAPQGPVVLERLNRLSSVCRAAGLRVIHTAHVVRPDGSNIGVMGELIPAVNAGVITQGNESARLHPRLKVEPGDIVLDKPRFGAFHGTELELILRSNGIESLIIGGIATNVCCETTAREANARDFRVHFLSDGTATFDLPDLGFGRVSAEDIQRMVCTLMAFAFARVRTVADVIAEIETTGARRSA
jgi:ureidoacrylate peracid hydrolase